MASKLVSFRLFEDVETFFLYQAGVSSANNSEKYINLFVKFSSYKKCLSTSLAHVDYEETLICFYFRLFEHPEPGRFEVLEAVDQLRCAVECRLKSKSCLPLTIDFPSHVFRYLFEGKGEVNGGWLYLNKDDFVK